jgi:hypothetical protein
MLKKLLEKIKSLPLEEKIFWPPTIALGIIAVWLLIDRTYEVFFKAEREFPQWNVTGNLTDDSKVVTFIVTDPNGQKFLVINYKGGTSTIPYVPIDSTK